MIQRRLGAITRYFSANLQNSLKKKTAAQSRRYLRGQRGTGRLSSLGGF
jgi:hypothetical protein